MKFQLAGPPHNIRREAERPNSEYDVFTKKNNGEMLDMAEFALIPRGT